MLCIMDLLVLLLKHSPVVHHINNWTDVFWMHSTVSALHVPVQKILSENERVEWGNLKYIGKIL